MKQTKIMRHRHNEHLDMCNIYLKTNTIYAKNNIIIIDRFHSTEPVSYTHLTLPTILRV